MEEIAESKAVTGKKFLKISKVVDDIDQPILLYEYDTSKIKTAPLKFIDIKTASLN